MCVYVEGASNEMSDYSKEQHTSTVTLHNGPVVVTFTMAAGEHTNAGASEQGARILSREGRALQ